MKFENKEALDKYIEEQAAKKAEELAEEKLAEEQSKAKPKVEPPERGIEMGKTPEEKLAEDKRGGFKDISDYAFAIYKAGQKEGPVVLPKLAEWDRVTKTLQMAVPDAGGYLMPSEFSAALISNAIGADPLLTGMFNFPMSTGTAKLPYIKGFDQSGNLVYGGIKWYWKAEGAQATASEPKFGEFSMTLHELMGLCKVSRTLMEYSPVSVGAMLQAGFADGLNAMLNNAIVRGTGAGQPLGILNSPALISVAKETGQGAATIITENTTKMLQRFYAKGGGVWLVNRDCLTQLITMSVAVGTGGGPIFIPGNSAANRPNDTLWGYPILYFDHCSTLGTEGDILLVNPSQYWLATKAGMESPRFESSIHLYFDYNEEAFAWLYFADGNSPWAEALKPPQSAETRSPFVALATRS
jgi:HK97 family phage major capsid protein